MRERSFYGITLKALYSSQGRMTDWPMVSSKLCAVFGCGKSWHSCNSCPAYDDGSEVAEQIAAILAGLA